MTTYVRRFSSTTSLCRFIGMMPYLYRFTSTTSLLITNSYRFNRMTTNLQSFTNTTVNQRRFAISSRTTRPLIYSSTRDFLLYLYSFIHTTADVLIWFEDMRRFVPVSKRTYTNKISSVSDKQTKV